jgi:hypothetical protein
MFIRWDEEVVVEANKRHRSGDASPVITFECETLKSDTEAEDHIKKFMPSLIGRDAVGGSTYSHVPLLFFIFKKNFLLLHAESAASSSCAKFLVGNFGNNSGKHVESVQ